MGYFLQEHDIYIGSLLSELNVRFGPLLQATGKGKTGASSPYGGIDEMVALQKEFKIFKKGRSFKTSVSALNVAAFNNDTKQRWHNYLDNLARHGSNVGSANGDQAIVAALVKNLGARNPLPVYFTSHDMREDNRVLVTDKSRPVFYLEKDFLSISMPMQPASAAGKSTGKKTAAKTTSKPAGKAGNAAADKAPTKKSSGKRPKK